MGDWSTLPGDLLLAVFDRLHSSVDRLRFRSVCSTWRGAATPPPIPPIRYPILPNSVSSDAGWGFCVSKRIIYSLLPPCNSLPWIFKLERHRHRMRLLDPLCGSSSPIAPRPPDFPKLFTFLDRNIRELSEEYALKYINPVAESRGNLYSEKVAVLNNSAGGFILVTIDVSGKLVVYRSGDREWEVMAHFPSPYDDVILRSCDKFYAVDHTGRTVAFDGADAKVTEVAESIGGGDKKYLVEREGGELLLVDKYLMGGMSEELEWFVAEKAFEFEVWRLDEREGRWVEVSDLGNGAVLVGDNSTFWASTEECGRRNCIVFRDAFGGGTAAEEGVVRVFDLESGVIEEEAIGALFWPPPHWISAALPDQVQNTTPIKTT
ncbi:hypothetical protein M569_00683 [Genlisea aurea]|uniref:Uncharacterized protein n=1 Tax=Genlisea aurea TaxID=192259 RepID=S8D3T4_9LAMI|nr:hypothetical protein M569_00683 [Genlisea aurea]